MRPFHLKNLSIFTLPVSQLNANCYLVYDNKTLDTLIIDPGDDADYIERVISDNNAKPQFIVATHGHFDHIMAGFELQSAYDVPFWIHKKDEFLVSDLRSRAKRWLKIEPPPSPTIGRFLKEKDTIKIGSTTLTVIETPGHTPGGICLYGKSEEVLFVGDLIFSDNLYGRTDFSYSNKDDLALSIKKIKSLPCDTIVFPGHGEHFFLSNYTFTLR